MKEVEADTFEPEVIKSALPVVVDFWGPQWVSCLKAMPQVKALGRPPVRARPR
jgi:thioredoxin 1